MEILTGIAGEAFKEWLYEKYGDKEVPTDFEKNYLIVTFNRLSPEQQQGDLLAFFRDKGIDVEITKWEDEQREMDNIRTNKYYWIIYVDNEFKSLDCECKTYEMQHNYTTAFNEAINKAVEIYNGEVRIVSKKCVNSKWTADWLARKNQEACQCIVQCKIEVVYKKHIYIVTKDEYKILKRLTNKEK